jgi:hypothetical protein
VLAPVFLPEVTAPQREAVHELVAGPLYRTGDTFQRQGGTRRVRLQTIRSLLDLRLASWNPDTKTVLATARLIERAQQFGLIKSAGDPTSC